MQISQEKSIHFLNRSPTCCRSTSLLCLLLTHTVHLSARPPADGQSTQPANCSGPVTAQSDGKVVEGEPCVCMIYCYLMITYSYLL